MLGSETIVQLYNRVLDNDIVQYDISENAIKIGIKSMTEVYKPSEQKDRSTVADFNDVAHRCAYLHKYASLHTSMVRDLMFSAIRQNYNFFYNLLMSESPFKICSLGGGPGSDVVGVLTSLVETFMHCHSFEFNISVVDYMSEWVHTFSSIINELGTGRYGPFGPSAGQALQWRYLGANLLKALSPEVEYEISTANLITMIKFVSAANCKDTEFMVKNILSAMKPGAVLFFVDNDGGGFREMITKYALKFNFIPLVGPLKHENYSNPVVKTRRFGAVSCHKTTVSVSMLQKPGENVNLCVNLSPGGESRWVNWDRNSNFATGIPNAPLTPLFPNTPLTPYIYQLEKYSLNSIHNQPADPYALLPTPLNSIHNQPADPYAILPTPLNSMHNQPADPYALLPTPQRNMPYDSALYSGNPIFTPDTPRATHSRIQNRNGGCLPLSRFRHLRHHLSTKLNSFKSRIQNKYRKKKKTKNAKGKDSK